MAETLGLSMIIKDEPIDRLAMLVDYLKPTVSQFSITDTGTDWEEFKYNEPLIKSWGVTLDRIEWRDDFAAARNYTLQYLTTDWVLHLDADELPTRQMMEHIQGVLDGSNAMKTAIGWLYFTRNFWGGERGIEVEAHWHCRLFRNGRGRWYKRLHEQVELDKRPEGATRNGPFLPRAPMDAYLIHSKPREKIEKSAELYKRMEE